MCNSFEDAKQILKEQYKNSNWQDGVSPEELQRGVEQIIAQNYEIRKEKAECIAYILRNARIDLCKEEIFADKLDHNDIMLEFFWHKCDEIHEQCPESHKKAELAFKIKAFKANMDFGHIAPDWDFLMKNGIVGVLERLKKNREKYIGEAEKRNFYDGCITVYEAICDLLERYAGLAESRGDERSLFVAQNLRALCVSAPKTLAEAMQLTFIIYNVQTSLDATVVRSLGGLDRLYYPFFKADLESGRCNEIQLRELTARMLWKISAMKVGANLPFYICGKKDGKDATNEYTRIILEEYRKLDVDDPKIHVMYHEDMDRQILSLILEMIREGKTSFVFIKTNAASKALEHIGVTPEDAQKVIVYGCYETAAEGLEVPATCGGMFNLAKAVELALNNGADIKTGLRFGPETGTDFSDFNAFFEAVITQLEYSASTCMDCIADYESYYGRYLPTPVISATFESSAQSGTDLFAGGAKYNNTSIVGAGLATLTDSVLAVKKAVFEENKISFTEFVKCIKADWHGYEELKSYCSSHPIKYGNGIAEADDIAVRLFTCFESAVNKRKNGRGGVFRCGMFSVDWRYWMGEDTAATPDGRMSGEPLSKNTAASLGKDKAGVTALMNTLLKLDSSKIPDGYVADIVLHESAVRGEEGMVAFKALLTSFMKRSGFSVHFNVLDPEILRKAQKEPEKYKNLQIRVCGWNEYFVDMNKNEQNEFIKRSSMG